jgi:transposase
MASVTRVHLVLAHHRRTDLRRISYPQLMSLLGEHPFEPLRIPTAVGRKELEGLSLGPWASRRRQQLLDLLDQLEPVMEELDRAVIQEAEKRPAAVRLMTQPGVGPVTALAFVLTIGPVERFRRTGSW